MGSRVSLRLAVSGCLVLILLVTITSTLGRAQGKRPPGTGNLTELVAELQDRVAALETDISRLWADLLHEVALRTDRDTVTDAAIGAVAVGVDTVRLDVTRLGERVDATPGTVVSYRWRAEFEAAAGETSTIDFLGLPAGQATYPSLVLSGVTFHGFGAYYQQLIYSRSSPIAVLRIDLPPDTRAIGADLGTFYTDPGLFSIALSTGQESTTTRESGFVGVVSDRPVEWTEIRFYSACLPTAIFGTATCPALPIGYTPGIMTLDNFTFGPGS